MKDPTETSLRKYSLGIESFHSQTFDTIGKLNDDKQGTIVRERYSTDMDVSYEEKEE